MEFIVTILTAVFIAMLIGLTITFGFTLLFIIIATSVLAGFFALIVAAWRRWRFVHSQPFPNEKRTEIIEVEYTDITDKEK